MRGKPKTKITRKTLRRKRRQAQAAVRALIGAFANVRPPSTFMLTANDPPIRRLPAPQPTDTSLALLARLGLA